MLVRNSVPNVTQIRHPAFEVIGISTRQVGKFCRNSRPKSTHSLRNHLVPKTEGQFRNNLWGCLRFSIAPNPLARLANFMQKVLWGRQSARLDCRNPINFDLERLSLGCHGPIYTVAQPHFDVADFSPKRGRYCCVLRDKVKGHAWVSVAHSKILGASLNREYPLIGRPIELLCHRFAQC